MYDEKKTQNTSYISKPVNNRVDTFNDGNRTKAMKATQRPIPIAEKIHKFKIMQKIQRF